MKKLILHNSYKIKLLNTTQLPKKCIVMAMLVVLCLTNDKLAHTENNLYTYTPLPVFPSTVLLIE